MNDYEELALWSAERDKEKLNETEKGKYIFCEAKEEGDTRLFIHQLCIATDVMRKNGWWDTFTISETPCKKGITLCSIREFTQDKTGYLMLIVVPVKHLGLTIDEQSAAWDYLYRSGNFSSQYMNHSHANRWNEEALNEKFADLFKSEKEIFLNNPIMKKYYLGDYVFFSRLLLNKWILDEITLDDIAEPLNTKFGIEMLAEDLFKNRKKYAETHPRLVSKLPMNDGYLYLGDVESFLRRKQWEYEDLLAEGLVNPVDHLFDRIEEICVYREKEKEAKKAAKKAARLAKKNN